MIFEQYKKIMVTLVSGFARVKEDFYFRENLDAKTKRSEIEKGLLNKRDSLKTNNNLLSLLHR